MSSPGCRIVAPGPVKNDSGPTSLLPPGPEIPRRALRAIREGAISEAGEARPMLPPSVARFLIEGDPNAAAASVSRGWLARRAGECSISAMVVKAPMRIPLSPSRSMEESPAIRFRLTRTGGVDLPPFHPYQKVGAPGEQIRFLFDPDSILTASASVAGSKYEKGVNLFKGASVASDKATSKQLRAPASVRCQPAIEHQGLAGHVCRRRAGHETYHVRNFLWRCKAVQRHPVEHGLFDFRVRE